MEHYLLNKRNINKDNIESIDPFMANLEGDKNWLVYVKLKGDKRNITTIRIVKRQSGTRILYSQWKRI